jgi:chromosome condensin MukBEF ATPase and DNA-binding subunit MukB
MACGNRTPQAVPLSNGISCGASLQSLAAHRCSLSRRIVQRIVDNQKCQLFAKNLSKYCVSHHRLTSCHSDPELAEGEEFPYFVVACCVTEAEPHSF